MSNVDDHFPSGPDWYINRLNSEVKQIQKMLQRLEPVQVADAYAASLHRAQEKLPEVRTASMFLSKAQTLLEEASRGIANQNSKSSEA